MRKIPRVFLPDGQELGLAGREIDPQCLWVLHYGRATRKFDGTCCLVRDGKLYARRQIKIKRLSAPTAEAIYRAAHPDFEPFFVGHQRVYGWITRDPHRDGDVGQDGRVGIVQPVGPDGVEQSGP